MTPYLDMVDMVTWVHFMVILILDYYNAPYIGLLSKSTWRLQPLHSAATLLLSGSRYSMHITPFLQALHWQPISYQAHFKVLAIIYKGFHGVGPPYLRDYFLPLCSTVTASLT